MDFREWKEIGREIGADYEQLTQAAGYDHNYVIRDWDGTVRLAAEAVCEESGIGVEVYTDARASSSTPATTSTGRSRARLGPPTTSGPVLL